MDAATIKALEAFPAQLDALYEVFPAAAKHWAPSTWTGIPSEALTAIEQLCHLRDIEVDGYQVRIRRTLEEWQPELASLNTDALARDRKYSQQNAREVLQEFKLARSRTLALVRACTSEQLDRPANFEGYGQVTLRGLVHYLCSHDQQHLSGMQWLLGKLYTQGVAANAA
jgi:DinB superfamily